MGEADNGNGRISTADRLARIETKLDQVLLLIPKVGDLERTQAAQDEKIKNICEDVDGQGGARIQLDIPENEMGNFIKAMMWLGKRLSVPGALELLWATEGFIDYCLAGRKAVIG